MVLLWYRTVDYDDYNYYHLLTELLMYQHSLIYLLSLVKTICTDIYYLLRYLLFTQILTKLLSLILLLLTHILTIPVTTATSIHLVTIPTTHALSILTQWLTISTMLILTTILTQQLRHDYDYYLLFLVTTIYSNDYYHPCGYSLLFTHYHCLLLCNSSRP